MSKIVVEKTSFSDALSVGASMAGRSKVMPILDSVKIVIEGNNAIISSYDSEVYITKHSSVLESDGDFSFCVNGKDFLNIVRAINEETISIEIKGGSVIVSHKKGKTSLPTFKVEEFCNPKSDEIVKQFIVNSKNLRGLLIESKKFCGNDQFRQIFTCVNIYANNGTLGAFSSDTTILYHNEYQDEGCIGRDLSFNLQSKAIDAVVSAISDDEEVEITLGTRNVKIEGSDTSVIVTMLEGRYPNARAVIPKTYNTIVSLSKSELLESIKRAFVTCSQTNAIIKFDIEKDYIDVSSQDSDFSKETNERIPCVSEGPNIKIGMKYTSIVNAISVLGENIELRLIGSNVASLWKSSDDDKKMVVIMPVIID